MGNACKFASSKPIQDAIISADDKSIPSTRHLLEKPPANPLPLEISNPQKNPSELKVASEKTNESLPQKENIDFEEHAPKQFVEIQINHLNKEDSLKNEDSEIFNDVIL